MPPNRPSETHTDRLPNLVDGELQCERCGELERRGMPRCTQNDCPYSPQQSDSIGLSCAVIGFLISLGMMAIVIVALAVCVQGVNSGQS
jgi:hypothetical protein